MFDRPFTFLARVQRRSPCNSGLNLPLMPADKNLTVHRSPKRYDVRRSSCRVCIGTPSESPSVNLCSILSANPRCNFAPFLMCASISEAPIVNLFTKPPRVLAPKQILKDRPPAFTPPAGLKLGTGMQARLPVGLASCAEVHRLPSSPLRACGMARCRRCMAAWVCCAMATKS